MRAKTMDAIDSTHTRVDAALKAGGDAVGAQTVIETLPGMFPLSCNKRMNELFAANAKIAYPDVEIKDAGHFSASTDMGDVSHLMPVIHPFIGGTDGLLHTPDFHMVDFNAAVLLPAKAFAMMLIDLLYDDAKEAKAILADFKPILTKEEYIAKLVELRQKKGMTEEQAREILLTNYLFYGVMMVKMKDADGMVSGACHSTADTLRPCLQILKTKPGTKLVSAFFVMVVPDCDMGENGTFVFADCGLNQNPTSEELAAIAQSSAESFKQLVGADPRVAMLSYSTMGSAKHDDVTKVQEAVKIAKAENPDLMLDGEMQLDAALVPSVGAAKAPGSQVAGKANTLIFPNLDAGNIGYKLVQRLAKAEAYGPMTQGIAAPVNDLSRGCSAKDIEGVVAITAVQCQNQ